MPVIPVILAAAATAGSAATAAAGAVAAGAAAAGTAAAAITATDVAVAGVATVIAAKVKKRYDAGLKEQGYEEGARATAAKYEKMLEKISAKLNEASQRIKDSNEFFKLIIALTAVGMATAAADGKVDEDELADLDELIGGLAHDSFPSAVRAAITELRNNPPSFNTAMQYVLKLDSIDRELFETVIQVIAESDGVFCESERAFLQAFKVCAV